MNTRALSVPLLSLATGAGLVAALAGGPATADDDRPGPVVPRAAEPVVVTTDKAGDVDAGVDLLKARLVNGGMVRVALTHDNLVRHPEYGVGASVFLDTDPAAKGPEFEFVGGLFEGTDYMLAETDGWKRGSAVNMKKCFYVMKLDYTNDRTVVRMEPDCLGDPQQVRVSVKATADSAAGAEHDWLGSRREFTGWASSTR